MSKKLQSIHEMWFSFDPYVELVFACYEDDKYSKDEKFIEQIRNFKKHRSLAGKWKTVSVLRESSGKADFVAVDTTRFGVSEKAKKILQSEYGDILEFLPLNVVGKLVEVGDEEVIKPIKKKETFYLLNPLAKISIGKKTQFVKHPACRDYHFCELNAEEVQENPIFRLPQAMPTMVTGKFGSFVNSKKLKGFRLDEHKKLDWIAKADARTKTAKIKTSTSKKPNSKPVKADNKISDLNQFPLPKSMEVLVGGPHRRMTKKIWNAILDSCNWCCDISEDREEDKPRRPKVSKPISKLQLEKLRKRVGDKLPAEFEHVLLNYSRKLDFFWSVFEAAEDAFAGRGERLTPLDPPEELASSLMGGEVLWDVGKFPKVVDSANKHPEFGKWVKLDEGRLGLLPFMDVGNGDAFAFDMRKGNKNCPIVYLCHDDGALHGVKIGDNFVDFLANWAAIGCVGPDFSYFKPFWNQRQKKISGSSRNAKRWQKFMATGK